MSGVALSLHGIREDATRWWTFANVLTLSRLVTAPACAFSILEGYAALALLFFGVAVVTDLLDGRVARLRGEVSRLGGFFDHATDATFVSLGLLAVALRGEISLWLPLLIAAAFVQYVLDSGVQEKLALRASQLGRFNGIAYFVFLGIVLVRDALGWEGLAVPIVSAGAWVLVASSVVSMLDRATAALRSSRS